MSNHMPPLARVCSRDDKTGKFLKGGRTGGTMVKFHLATAQVDVVIGKHVVLLPHERGPLAGDRSVGLPVRIG
jgi:hypothetical protein